MWRNKKVIVGTVLAAVVVLASLGGVALAQTGSGEDGKMTEYQVIISRVCEIYQDKTGDAIDQELLKKTVWQVIKWTRPEALQDRVQKWVDKGCIEQGKADRALKWFQAKPRLRLKAWAALKIYEWKTGDSIDRRAFRESIIQALEEVRAE